jgi:hypothetical protein
MVKSKRENTHKAVVKQAFYPADWELPSFLLKKGYH